MILSFLKISIQTEITKHKGRIDAVIETDKFLYIMEYKVETSGEKTAQKAIDQIKDKAYMASYENSPKTILLVGIVFDRIIRNVKEWKAEVWKRN